MDSTTPTSEGRKPIYGIGDKVKIVNYGSLLWEAKPCTPVFKVYKETEELYWTDITPELVGKEALIKEVSMTQGIPSYALSGVNKVAWYGEEQLEMINKNPNR